MKQGRTLQTIDACEYDALGSRGKWKTEWLGFRAGQRKKEKKKYNRRVRKFFRELLRLDE